MLDLVTDLFRTIILPAALTSAAVIALASWKLGRKGLEIAVPFAVIAGLLAGNFQRKSVPYLPEDFGWEWVLACAVVALAVEWLKVAVPLNYVRLRVLLFMPIFVIAFVLMPTEWRNGLTVWAFAIVIALNAIAFALARPSHPAVAIIVACAILGGASLVLICAAFARLSDVAVLLSASVAGLLVVSLRPLPLRGLSLMIGMAVPGLMLNGRYNQSPEINEVPLASYLLVSIAPMFFLIGRILSLRRRPHWLRTAFEVALPLIVVGLGVALAISAEGLGTGDDWDSEPEPSEKEPADPEAKPEPIEP